MNKQINKHMNNWAIHKTSDLSMSSDNSKLGKTEGEFSQRLGGVGEWLGVGVGENKGGSSCSSAIQNWNKEVKL